MKQKLFVLRTPPLKALFVAILLTTGCASARPQVAPHMTADSTRGFGSDNGVPASSKFHESNLTKPLTKNKGPSIGYKIVMTPVLIAAATVFLLFVTADTTHYGPMVQTRKPAPEFHW